VSESILPQGWPRPSGYSNALSASGRVIALAGQIGWNPRTQGFETDDFVEQTRQALRNIVAVLEAAGARTEHVVRLTWFVTNANNYLWNREAVGTAYRDVFGGHFPAMSVVVVAGLLERRALVEIEATAVV
jgi:enamine deaminase RidA (YjgF/YER057c/UK114 family)